MLGLEFLGLTLVLNNNHWLVVSSGFNLEWPKLAISLNGLISELSSDESLGIEDGVQWISGGLILSGISDKSLVFSEGDVRWGGVKSLIVGDDFNFVVHPNSNAGVSGSKIDTDSSRHEFLSVFKKLIINLLRKNAVYIDLTKLKDSIRIFFRFLWNLLEKKELASRKSQNKL